MECKSMFELCQSIRKGSLLNFSHLARMFGLKEKDNFGKDNYNQVVRKFLEDSGVDLNRFKYHKKIDGDQYHVRRAKEKFDLPNTSRKISGPTDPCLGNVKILLNELILNGTYDMGQLIAPIEFFRVISTGEEVKYEKHVVRGRKASFDTIRENLFKKHEKFYRIWSDVEIDEMSIDLLKNYLDYIGEQFEDDDYVKLKQRVKCLQRRRFLGAWHDGALVCSHSFIVFTINEFYDPAIHINDAEARDIFHKNIDVQAFIEEPEIYIFARCPGTVPITLYSEYRMRDINTLSEPLEFNGVEVYDVLRFFKGDGPSCQVEAGHQKGGNFFCWVCGISCSQVSDYTYAAFRGSLSLEDRQRKVLQTKRSTDLSKRKCLNLYSTKKRVELMDELDERGLGKKYHSHDNNKVLEQILKVEMEGIQRVPSLLFNNPEEDIGSSQLQFYEILGCEPLHDVVGHIRNIFEEIPAHVEAKSDIQTFLTTTVFDGKEAKNGSDYRHAVIKAYLHFRDCYPNHVITEILSTLCEMQRILYQREAERTRMSILRLYFQTFLHVLSVKKQFEKPKNISSRKLFGKYYHALTAHAPDQNRILPGRSAAAESNERMIGTLKDLAKNTSNHHTDNIVANCFIRIQVGNDFDPSKDNVLTKTEASISRLYKPIKLKLQNSFISFELMKTYPWQYQAVLEKNGDFLVFENCWIEVAGGVEFYDVTLMHSPNKSPHHFRSFSGESEMAYVRDCWNICLKDAHRLIPACKIKIETENEGHTKIEVIELKTLQYFQVADTPMDDPSSHNFETADGDVSPIRIVEKVLVSTPKARRDIKFEQNSLEQSRIEKEKEDFLSSETEVSSIKAKPVIFYGQNSLELSNIGTEKGNLTFINSAEVKIYNNDGEIDFVRDDIADEVDASDDEVDASDDEIIFSVPQNLENKEDILIAALYEVLGDDVLINQFKDVRRKVHKFHGEAMYLEEMRMIGAQLEVKLVAAKLDCEKRLDELQRRKLANSYVGIDLIPNKGNGRIEYEKCIEKLSQLERLKEYFDL